MTVHNLYNYFTPTDMSKLYHLELPKYIHNLLNIDNTKQRIELPLLYTSHYQNNFAYQGPRLWNLIRNSNYLQLYDLSNLNLSFLNCNLITTWTSTNFDMQLYISKSKSDPYFYESMNKTALDTISRILHKSAT